MMDKELTRNQKKIYEACLSVGYVPDTIKWEPIGVALEMCGPSGGWEVDGYPVGYNVKEAVNCIKGKYFPLTARFRT